MKKNYLPMVVAMILVTSCQMKTKTGPFDPVVAKAEVTKTLDSIDTAFKSKDAKTMLSFFTEDGLYCGTDPAELWDKAGYTTVITKMLADTIKFRDMKYDKTEIRFDKEGNSVNVLRQFVTSWSKPVQVRSVIHLVKADKRWMVDFSNFALIPENKDLAKIALVVK